MNDSLNNKELVAVGHEFAKTLSSDRPIIEMAKLFTSLAERLDCTTMALREMTKQRKALAVRLENADKLQDSSFRHRFSTVLAWGKPMMRLASNRAWKHIA